MRSGRVFRQVVSATPGFYVWCANVDDRARRGVLCGQQWIMAIPKSLIDYGAVSSRTWRGSPR